MTRIALADDFIGRLGYEAYRVGGSVRDEIAGKRPKDADYVIRGVTMGDLGRALVQAGAKISEIENRDRSVQLGWRTALPKIGLVEIVLPRTERNAGIGRAQEIVVEPSIPLAEDAKRRDFTFNALYKGVGPDYPESALEGGVIDPTSTGLYDLQHRIVRTTHEDSFRNDPLRTLRALRFVSTLSADLSDDTYAQMVEHADAVDGWVKGGTSGTVLSEVKKLLMGQCPAKALRIARDTGVLERVLPEVKPMLGFDQGSRYHDLTTCEHTFKALETAAHVDAPLRVRMALLFHDAGKPESAWCGTDGRLHYYAPTGKEEKALRGRLDDDLWRRVRPEDHEVVSARIWDEAAKRLNVDKTLRDNVRTLILHHMVPVKTRNPGTRARRMRVQFGDDLAKDLLLHRVCDLSGKGVKVALNHIEHVAKLEELRQEAQDAGVPASVKDLKVNGQDAKVAGLTGRAIGEALGAVLDEIVCNPSLAQNDREWQLARLEAACR